MKHVLTFDIEDWFHMVAIPAVDDPAQWPQLHADSSLVERYTDHILDLCAEAEAKATFFVLGWVAERHPDLIRRIHDAGHEIGSHSYWHRRVYSLRPDVFRDDLQLSRDVIQAAAPAANITGFRAPSFSITEGAEWAFDTLLDCGFEYDASLFPGKRGHGGYDCPPGPHVVTAPSGRTMPELPMSLTAVGAGPVRKRMCYSGGGYLRLLPYPLIRAGIAREAAEGRPTVIYLHPRDFAPDCPRVPMPLHRRFKCYVGASATTGKLRRLLRDHEWRTCGESLGVDVARVN